MLGIKNCMDAMTTSPVEGQNKVIKHSPDYVNRNFHMDKSLSKIVRAIAKRLRRKLREAKQEESQMNNASTAPTKNDLIRKGQALVDRNHDRRQHLRSAQIAKNRWMVWNCNAIDHIEVPDPLMLHLPRFVRVRQLHLTSQSAYQHYWKLNAIDALAQI